VETAPTPKENIILLSYFLKMRVLNGFRPCTLEACRFAQKPGDQQSVRETRI
jgi:hypothetical protein